jgi:hypothetical protein
MTDIQGTEMLGMEYKLVLHIGMIRNTERLWGCLEHIRNLITVGVSRGITWAPS